MATGRPWPLSAPGSRCTNFRLRWEYAPGSEIFIVYTEERDTDVFVRFSELLNRGLVIKVNRLLRLEISPSRARAR